MAVLMGKPRKMLGFRSTLVLAPHPALLLAARRLIVSPSQVLCPGQPRQIPLW